MELRPAFLYQTFTFREVVRKGDVERRLGVQANIVDAVLPALPLDSAQASIHFFTILLGDLPGVDLALKGAQGERAGQD